MYLPAFVQRMSKICNFAGYIVVSKLVRDYARKFFLHAVIDVDNL
jgi:hypothetical protein